MSGCGISGSRSATMSALGWSSTGVLTFYSLAALFSALCVLTLFALPLLPRIVFDEPLDDF